MLQRPTLDKTEQAEGQAQEAAIETKKATEAQEANEKAQQAAEALDAVIKATEVTETKIAADEKVANTTKKQNSLRPTAEALNLKGKVQGVELTEEELKQIRKLNDEQLLKLRTDMAAKAKDKSGLAVTKTYWGWGSETHRLANDKLEESLLESQLVKDAKSRLELQAAQRDGMRSDETMNLPSSAFEQAAALKIEKAKSSTGLIRSMTFVDEKTSEAPYVSHLKKELENKHNTTTAFAGHVSKQKEVNSQVEYVKDVKLKETDKFKLGLREGERLGREKTQWELDQHAKSKPWFDRSKTSQQTAAEFIKMQSEKEKAAALKAEKEKAATAPTLTGRRP